MFYIFRLCPPTQVTVRVIYGAKSKKTAESLTASHIKVEKNGKEASVETKMHFAVVGSGVVGLSTALELQKQFPNAHVTIVADKFGIETTSDVAAGIFRPGTNFSGPTDNITRYVDKS